MRPRTLLHFLGLTGKSGVLRVRERDRQAAVWFRGGEVVRVDADVLDSIVAMLRVPSGHFEFEEITPPGEAAGVPVAVLLEQAAELLLDWEETAQAVPSTTLVIELRHTDDEARLSSDAWAVSVAVSGGHITPASAADHLRWGMLRTCRAVKELVDSGRAAVLPPVRTTTPVLVGKADVVLTSGVATQPLWPGATAEAGSPWRTAWYDPGE
jgi:hypothetical protein